MSNPMRYEAFVQPGVGASDALVDWLEQHEMPAAIKDVNRDEQALAEALAIGGGRLPVLRFGQRVLLGFEPARLEEFTRRATTRGGIVLEADPQGQVVIREVAAGSQGEAAGLQPGDIVVKVGGYTMFTVEQLEGALARPRPGRLAIEVRRGEEVLALRVRMPLAGR